jgi:phage repressor protein C with HTH and peptisase S24 domain
MQTRLSLRLSDTQRMDLAKSIRDARIKAKLSQAALGKLLGVSKAAVSQWETGRNMPDPRRLQALLKALNLDPRIAIGGGEIDENAHLPLPDSHAIITQAPSDVRRDAGAPPLPNRADLPRTIPVLGVAAGAASGDFTMNDGNAIAYALETPGISGRKDVFALFVQNDSMVPWREPGQLVYVDAHQPPKITDYVVVEMKAESGSGERAAYLKRLAGRSGNMLRLEQFNPAKVFSVDMRKVHKVYRVIDWSELLA